MAFFNVFGKRPLPTENEHPAFQLGQRFKGWLDQQSVVVAEYLNRWQHQIGFRARNRFLVGLGGCMLAYFLYDLLTTFY